MDFSLSAEQRELTEAAADFARKELNQDLAKREDAGDFPQEAWRKCAEFGVQGLPVPTELGGAGADVLTTALVMEALGYGCHDNGLLFSLNAQMWSVELPLVLFGTPAQQQAYLPGMMSGDLIGAHAMTEAGSGSDALHMHTRAERHGDHYLMQGTKQYITNAPVADVLLVYAVDPSRPSLSGVSAFLVDAATSGLAVSSSFEKMGLRTSPMGEITLHDCVVPAESRLGPEGAGMAIFNSSMEWERSCLFASTVGAMRRQLEACVEYARSREQFGQPIGKFQGVSGKLADMYVRLEAARSLIYRVAWLKQQGKSAPAEAATAKLFTSEAFVRSSEDAIQVHGALGYVKEAGIERDLRDAVAGTIYSGTSEIQRVVIARMLGLLAPGQAGHDGQVGRKGSVMAYLLQRLLTDAAARQPQRPAVASDGCLISYQELDRLSNKVARALLRLGVAPGDRVGILAPKSAAAVIGLYGTLKAGACYVPLDPKTPAGRLSHIMQDSGATVIVADEARTSQAATLAEAMPRPPEVVVVDVPDRPEREEAASVPAQSAATVPWTAVAGESGEPLAEERAVETDLAYILYTSGSTGTPKGVMISHRNSLTFVDWAAAASGLSEQDRVCSPAPLTFDLSVFDIFATCRAAACMTVLPEGAATFPVSIVKFLEAERISVWYSVPSVLTLLACYGSLQQFDLSDLRVVIFAGEVFPPKHLARLIAELPHPQYLNWYGPTETNVCTAFEVPAGWADAQPTPIGKACANTEVFAVTREGGLISRPGEEGELYVRGPSLMCGYWGQPAKTNEALVRNPFRAEYDEFVYRTGDLVTLEASGNYVFLGRRDSMTKIRGYRVELGEVEATLYRHPAIQEAVVLPVPDELLGSRLRAVVTADGGSKITRENVLDHCRRWLPTYMVPDIVEFRDKMPRTSTGKVDRAGLALEQNELEPAGDGRRNKG